MDRDAEHGPPRRREPRFRQGSARVDPHHQCQEGNPHRHQELAVQGLSRPQGRGHKATGLAADTEGQTTLAQKLEEHGYRSIMVTDTMHQFKPSYNMHEGYEAFDFIRGQTTDNCQPNRTYPPEKVEEAILFDVKEDPEMGRSVAGEHQEVLDYMWNDYVLADAGSPRRRC